MGEGNTVSVSWCDVKSRGKTRGQSLNIFSDEVTPIGNGRYGKCSEDLFIKKVCKYYLERGGARPHLTTLFKEIKNLKKRGKVQKVCMLWPKDFRDEYIEFVKRCFEKYTECKNIITMCKNRCYGDAVSKDLLDVVREPREQETYEARRTFNTIMFDDAPEHINARQGLAVGVPAYQGNAKLSDIVELAQSIPAFQAYIKRERRFDEAAFKKYLKRRTPKGYWQPEPEDEKHSGKQAEINEKTVDTMREKICYFADMCHARDAATNRDECKKCNGKLAKACTDKSLRSNIRVGVLANTEKITCNACKDLGIASKKDSLKLGPARARKGSEPQPIGGHPLDVDLGDD